MNVSDSEHGFHTISFEHPEEFAELLGKEHFRDHPEYIFRGHRDPSYELLPSLYRDIRREFTAIRSYPRNKEVVLEQRKVAGQRTAAMLRHFLLGLRGTAWHESAHETLINWFAQQKSGVPHISTLREDCTNDPILWSALVNTWALGQHNGLRTPLLDWTESPLTAFYFAFERTDERQSGDESRVVFALNRKIVNDRCKHLGFDAARLEFIQPFSRTNPRMIAQQGLFTYSHVYETVEDWVREIFAGENYPVLIRFLIRNVNTAEAIRWLNRAGINDRNLFPDLHGVTRFSNRTFADNKLSYV